MPGKRTRKRIKSTAELDGDGYFDSQRKGIAALRKELLFTDGLVNKPNPTLSAHSSSVKNLESPDF